MQAFELCFWSDEASFRVVGEAIARLKQFKSLSLSQSLVHPNRYELASDPMKDDLFINIATSCTQLRDISFGSFYAITNATWEVISLFIAILTCVSFLILFFRMR